MGGEIKATKLMTALILSVLTTLEHNAMSPTRAQTQTPALTMRLLLFPQDTGGRGWCKVL